MVFLPGQRDPSVGECYIRESLAQWVLELNKETGPKGEALPRNIRAVLGAAEAGGAPAHGEL